MGCGCGKNRYKRGSLTSGKVVGPKKLPKKTFADLEQIKKANMARQTALSGLSVSGNTAKSTTVGMPKGRREIERKRRQEIARRKFNR